MKSFCRELFWKIIYLLAMLSLVCGCKTSQWIEPQHALVMPPPPELLLASYTKEVKEEKVEVPERLIFMPRVVVLEAKKEVKKAGEVVRPELAPPPRVVRDLPGNPEVREPKPPEFDEYEMLKFIAIPLLVALVGFFFWTRIK